MKNISDILIIGGGAAGLFAAITAAKTNPNARITLLEREARVGKKLLTTGNGRCNLSNASGLNGRYYGDTEFAKKAFSQFGVKDTCSMMKTLGIDPIVLEEGKIFPRSLQAGSVVDQLRLAAADLGVDVITDTTVTDLVAKEPFTVVTDKGDFIAKKVLIASGGKSSVGKYNGTTGYDLLKRLGYGCTALHPAIVQVTTEKESIKPLAGIKVEGKVTAKVKGQTRQEAGEILFTEYGVSGPPVLQISALISQNGGGQLTLNLLPDLTEQEIITEIHHRKHAFGHRTCEDLLTGFVNKRLGQTVLKQAGIEKLSLPCHQLTSKQIATVARLLKAFPLKATGTKGFATAQVTAGGILTKDFDPCTMESKRHRGLFVAGELFNVTGDCGGFNLQWAWTSGYLAGTAMAKEDAQ
jgi:predicted Rossmann fold flavoprotein